MNKIGVIGAGAMAEALIEGFLSEGVFASDDIYISDIKDSRVRELEKKYGVVGRVNNKDLVSDVDYIVLAVKPKGIFSVLEEVKEEVKLSQIVISIAAGISTENIEEILKEGAKVVRLMPNTPLLVGEGAIAYSLGSSVSLEEGNIIEELLSPISLVAKVGEEQMAAVTGLSGSGPAYIYLIIEALMDAGINVGLDKELALDLSLQTVIGSAKMVKESNLHPAELKNMVTSPGGTTIAALKVLEERGLRSALYEAVEASANKSKRLKEES
ncbi:pyrroline-5-carboxylate reductase [Halonatronum saccharophilum]|uniref:pyrroline-5-carboxylate reductase n=1 Tax=Halonatronum saccharophilum TaxID=150060 RepID=UPI00054E314D|nr:pyrroline-5-carboxylate reductase [Halonatronum saccharophilum]